MEGKILVVLLCLTALVTLSWTAPAEDTHVTDSKEEKVAPGEVDGLQEEDGVKEEEDMDPRLRRMKRQVASYPYDYYNYYNYYPYTRGRRGRGRGRGRTRGTRRRYRYPYYYDYYYQDPYYNYPYYPYNTPAPPITSPTQPPQTSSCGCAVSDTNCLTTCYYNEYLRNLGYQ